MAIIYFLTQNGISFFFWKTNLQFNFDCLFSTAIFFNHEFHEFSRNRSLATPNLHFNVVNRNPLRVFHDFVEGLQDHRPAGGDLRQQGSFVLIRVIRGSPYQRPPGIYFSASTSPMLCKARIERLRDSEADKQRFYRFWMFWLLKGQIVYCCLNNLYFSENLVTVQNQVSN